MMIYPEPSPLSAEPALTDEVTLKTTIDCLIEHLPMEMQGPYSQETLFEILLRAASKHDSIDSLPSR